MPINIDMALAAIEAAHADYIEKPFVRTPAEVDSPAPPAKTWYGRSPSATAPLAPMLAVIDQPSPMPTGQAAGDSRPRQGDRRGAVKILVPGSHIMNLIHYFGGAPRTCSARMFQDGQPVTATCKTRQ